MTASLFQPITLDGLTFPNRIAVAPMCQYSAEDGSASDWHLYHWMNLAMSGAGMVTVEMTDVERRGRITHGCLGLYSDDNEAAARRTLDAARRVSAPGTKFGTQLAHAGRKASNRKPWDGGGPLQPGEDPWQTVSASAIAYDGGWNVPHALEDEEILQLIERKRTDPMARITLRQLLDHAAEQGYGVPAFNINNMEQGLAICQAAAACDAPVILQASRGARSYAGDIMLAKMMEALEQMFLSTVRAA
eukprot:gene40450-54704_t